MRYARNPHRELGEVRIEDIEIDVKSRDDIPTLLLGLQHLYCDEKLRSRLFALLEQHILPDSNRNVGRPGMELWNILVMGILKQGLGCDFDRLHQLVNHYSTIREFLGHTDLWEKKRYEYQTIVDNVSLLRPELLAKVNQMFVESGHSVARKKSRKKPSKPLCGRCDSFVVETDVHYPTDVNLLWDAMRCLIRTTGRAATRKGVPGWRQWKHLSDSLAYAVPSGANHPSGPSGAGRGVSLALSGTGAACRTSPAVAARPGCLWLDAGHPRRVSRPCQAADGPGRTSSAQTRDHPAKREGVFPFRAAHTLDFEGQGRRTGGTRGAGVHSRRSSRFSCCTMRSCGKGAMSITRYRW